jgi:hypothetical protein
MKLMPQPTADLQQPDIPSPLAGGQCFATDRAGEGFVYRLEPGAITRVNWLTLDAIHDGSTDLVFNLEFCEPGNDRPFMCRFTLLPQAQARLRFNTEALNMNRWRYHREGACLKPTIGGWRVDPARVDRLVLKVLYKAPGTVRWCMTPLRAAKDEPPLLAAPLLPKGVLLDELGQTTLGDWLGKTRDAHELVTRLRQQAAGGADSGRGGRVDRKTAGTGFFRTHHDGRRWWLVDPDGCFFWSTGPDCVKPSCESNIRLLHDALAWLPPRTGEFADAFQGEHKDSGGELEAFDYLKANLIRAFGGDWHAQWQRMVWPLLRGLGFNTAGNWSDTAAAARAGMPYVLPLSPLAPEQQRVPRIFRDFPDVFDPNFEAEAAVFASQLAATAGDPALIGYFLMNEPMWGFARLLVAEGMLRNSADCATRREFARLQRQQYASDEALAKAWQMEVSFAEIGQGLFTKPLTAGMVADLKKFSTLMVRKLYDTLSAACRKADANHLNLGARFASVPEDWILDAMGSFDVFSVNCYKNEADPQLGEVCRRLNVPAIIGEWHFGALDAGLPAPGIGHCINQEERGKAYRRYLEQSAAQPWCVGAHWFTLYDQSALGRADGENYNIGFLDVCHRPYEELAAAARVTHRRLYAVADGSEPPFGENPQYEQRLNM